jgi:hypothetical protein
MGSRHLGLLFAPFWLIHVAFYSSNILFMLRNQWAPKSSWIIWLIPAVFCRLNLQHLSYCLSNCNLEICLFIEKVSVISTGKKYVSHIASSSWFYSKLVILEYVRVPTEHIYHIHAECWCDSGYIYRLLNMSCHVGVHCPWLMRRNQSDLIGQARMVFCTSDQYGESSLQYFIVQPSQSSESLLNKNNSLLSY